MRKLPDSERIERDALAQLLAAAPPALAAALGLACEQPGPFALQAIAASLPASAIVINRVLGLGLGEAASAADVQQVVARYRAAGVSRYFVQVHPESQPPALGEWLLQAGLERARAWQKFERDVRPPPAVTTSLQCRPIGAADADAFARIVCDAFDLGDAARPLLALLPGCANWHAFMSFDGDAPAGTGALYVDDGFGWLDFGATAPAFRRRGGQSALMAARIAHAASLGCHTLFTCTGEDVPGDPQHSYSNIVRAGFTETYLRANHAPPRADAAATPAAGAA